MNPDKRIILYPAYIDAAKTVAEGRRIPKGLACSDPYVGEIHDCCKALKLECVVEAKHYPREWIPKGRIRVQLRTDEGQPVNPDIPDRRTLLLRLAELVPKHPGRSAKGRQGVAKPADVGPGASGSTVTSAAASGSKPAPSKKGKKGKK